MPSNTGVDETDFIYDCIVVGSGHAGSCAALSAVEHGCRPEKVLIVEKAPEEWVGGNGYFTAGAHRTVHSGLSDILPLVTNVSPSLSTKIDMEPYTSQDFLSDILRMSSNRSSLPLINTVVSQSRDAIDWLAKFVGVPFTLSFNRQAYEVEGRMKFWGGMVLSVEDGGKGMIEADGKALRKFGVRTRFETKAVELVVENGGDGKGKGVKGLIVESDGKREVLKSKAIVLAAGGYEASKEKRKKYLGEAWQNARVRGTPYNTGDCIDMAVTVGAKLSGDWEGCHSTCWDANADPDTGSRLLSNQYTKSGYPLGLMLNSRGLRFVDEGYDFRNFTYAMFGRKILEQPGGVAWQIYDQKVIKWLRQEEYGDNVVKKIWGDTLDDLVEKLAEDGLEDGEQFKRTIEEYNEAVQKFDDGLKKEGKEVKWDPAVKDGLGTEGLELSKSNWALTVNEGPFLAVKVSCGVTFTFGGLEIDPKTAGVVRADVAGSEKKTIDGLFCTGEMVGGLWYGNYPGGSGLTAATVFGRIAGRQVAKLVSEST